MRQRIAFASCGVCGLSCDRTGISTATGIGASRLPVTMRRMHVLPNALGLRGRHSPSSSGRRPAAAICRGACSPPTATGRSWPCSWAFKSLAPSPWLLPRPPAGLIARAQAPDRPAPALEGAGAWRPGPPGTYMSRRKFSYLTLYCLRGSTAERLAARRTEARATCVCISHA